LTDLSKDLSALVSSVLPVERGQFYGGTWHQNHQAQRLTSINPSTGAVLAEVETANDADVDAAVSSAKAAFKGWASTPPLVRARCLREAAARIRVNAADLALLDAADCGNPVKAMLFDAEIAASQLEYFAGVVLEIQGETIPTGNG
jgi:betaine-aldehyde dehydrogenase